MCKPFFEELPYENPLNITYGLKDMQGLVFFDSCPHESNPRWSTGRYSYIAFNPLHVFEIIDGKFYQDKVLHTNDPFDFLKKYLIENKKETHPDLPPFQGGLAGLLSYDLLHFFEKIPEPYDKGFEFPDLWLGDYDSLFAFDHLLKKAWAISFDQSKLEMLKSYYKPASISSIIEAPITELKCDFTKGSYERTLQKVIDYIYAGDIFQANLTRRLYGELPAGIDSFDLYVRLNSINPAPFSGYLNGETFKLLSSSPERFLKVSHKKVETRPIKGTRKRVLNEQEDQNIAEELKNNPKDRAENIMIVDLLRNDLSRVCKPYTVKTPELLEIESYQTVHHLVSCIIGELKHNKDCIDLIKATFPGGSITGAPKVRAMEIISECEPVRRGPYCGSLAFFGYNGSMDSSILIRTLCQSQNNICFHVGGGIVADSIPLDEYEETQTKATALIKTLCNESSIGDSF